MCVQNLLRNLKVQRFWKSVYICQSYDQKSGVLFCETVYILRRPVKLVTDEFLSKSCQSWQSWRSFDMPRVQCIHVWCASLASTPAVRQRVIFKTALHGVAPVRPQELCIPVESIPSRQRLRTASTGSVQIPTDVNLTADFVYSGHGVKYYFTPCSGSRGVEQCGASPARQLFVTEHFQTETENAILPATTKIIRHRRDVSEILATRHQSHDLPTSLPSFQHTHIDHANNPRSVDCGLVVFTARLNTLIVLGVFVFNRVTWLRISLHYFVLTCSRLLRQHL